MSWSVTYLLFENNSSALCDELSDHLISGQYDKLCELLFGVSLIYQLVSNISFIDFNDSCQTLGRLHRED